jgi:hypothetical protein
VSALSQASAVPVYSAELPWLGPVLGPWQDGDPVVPVGAVSDPVLGKALAAAFVPVRRARERLDPVRIGDAIVAWLAACHGDRDGCLRIDAPRAWWHGVDGLLMVLVYDYSSIVDDQVPATLEAQLARFAPTLKLAAGPLAMSDFPEPMQKEARRSIEALLRGAPGKLARGVVELPSAPSSGATFAVASCQYPAGFLDGDLAERSHRRLARCLGRRNPAYRPQRVLLLGDQVYVDATAGLFDPTAEHDRFSLPHQRLLAMKPLRHILRRVPVHAMLDDHEIEDNWEPVPGDAENEARLAEGRAAYLQYQRIADPRVAGADARAPLWHAFDAHGVPFFMADTRTERAPRDAALVGSAGIMSEAQLGALLDWLSQQRTNPMPKFVACPALPLPRHRRAVQGDHPASALRSDSWDGYPDSLSRVLGHIAKTQVRGVVFLSGDEHLSLVARATLRVDGREPVVVHSVHSSALYAPFPFANSINDNLVADEVFRLGECSVEVHTRFAAPGDGFAVLRVFEEDGRWRARCRFLRGPRPPGSPKWIDLLPC